MKLNIINKIKCYFKGHSYKTKRLGKHEFQNTCFICKHSYTWLDHRTPLPEIYWKLSNQKIDERRAGCK